MVSEDTSKKAFGLRPHPSVEEIEQGLRRWQDEFPDRISVESRGMTAEGRPLLLVRMTDKKISDEDRQVVLLTANHAGSELCATTTLLHATRWLLGDGGLPTEVRKELITLIMPVGVPDAYARVSDDEPMGTTSFGIHRAFNIHGSEPYRDWDWDGLKKKNQKGETANNPEGEALLSVMDEYMPDVYLDLHAVDREGIAAQESIGFSWGSGFARSYVRGFVEEIEAAANREGFCIMRPDENAGRLLADLSAPGAEHHFITSGRDITAPVFAYNRYHSIEFTCEFNFEESGLACIRRLLELGTERWPKEFFEGYPTNQVASHGLMSIAAWGETASQRRRSRVDLWQKTGQLCFGPLLPVPESGLIGACCATTLSAADRYLHDGSIETLLKALRAEPRFNADAIACVLQDSAIRKVPSPKEIHPCHGYLTRKYRDFSGPGYADKTRYQQISEAGAENAGDVSLSTDDPPAKGMAFRLFIPYLDATIADVQLDGHSIPESARCGYLVNREGGTIVQVNIPPEELRDFHVVTCHYKTPTTRKTGFCSEDWNV